MGDLGIKEGAAFNARNSHPPLETAGAGGVPRGEDRPVAAGPAGSSHRRAAALRRYGLIPTLTVTLSLIGCVSGRGLGAEAASSLAYISLVKSAYISAFPALTADGLLWSNETITPVITPKRNSPRSGLSYDHSAFSSALYMRSVIDFDSGLFQYGTMSKCWPLNGFNCSTTSANCGSDNERAASLFCNEIICSFWPLDKCSSYINKPIVKIGSITTPLRTRMAASDHFSDSIKIPMPTITPPTMAPPSSAECCQSNELKNAPIVIGFAAIAAWLFALGAVLWTLIKRVRHGKR